MYNKGFMPYGIKTRLDNAQFTYYKTEENDNIPCRRGVLLGIVQEFLV